MAALFLTRQTKETMALSSLTRNSRSKQHLPNTHKRHTTVNHHRIFLTSPTPRYLTIKQHTYANRITTESRCVHNSHSQSFPSYHQRIEITTLMGSATKTRSPQCPHPLFLKAKPLSAALATSSNSSPAPSKSSSALPSRPFPVSKSATPLPTKAAGTTSSASPS